MNKTWFIEPTIPSEILRNYKGMSPILAQILYNRGMDTPEDARNFISELPLKVNPFIMKDMTKAVTRIRQAIRQGEKMAVYGDFDADGVTSTTLMMQVLGLLGANARAYIPNRVDEGYGLNSPALKELANQGITLVVTVDCGIRSVSEVVDGKRFGLDIVVTDHHSVGMEIPPAVAVVNPQQADCEGDKHLAGCGVAFMVAYGILLKHFEEFGEKGYPKLRLSDLLDLVAIGTVADIMPLNTPLNRILVREGLKVINEGRRPGLRALAEVSKLTLGQINAQNIGFAFGPRINAAGRLESALTAYELLSAPNDETARPYAEKLQHLNTQRQELTLKSQQRISESIRKSGIDQEYLIFAQDDEVLSGIVGLVAGRLTEEYYRPTVILERGENESRASCRSIPEFHITHALDECADLLLRHGGHSMAAGLTVANENVPLLRQKLLEKANDTLDGMELLPRLRIDAELRLRDVTTALVEELRLLEPTGHRNPPPLFLSRRLEVTEKRLVGNDSQHLKLKLRGDAQPPVDAIAFRFGAWLEQLPPFLDVVYALELNEWQGRRTLQLRIEDMRSSDQ